MYRLLIEGVSGTNPQVTFPMLRQPGLKYLQALFIIARKELVIPTGFFETITKTRVKIDGGLCNPICIKIFQKSLRALFHLSLQYC